MRSASPRKSSVSVFGVPVSWMSAALLAALLLICAVVGHLLWNTRTLEMKRASTQAANLCVVLTQDIARNIELFDLSIQAVTDGLADPSVMADVPRLRHLILFDRAATASYLGAILVIDETGKLVLDSRSLQAPAVNYADRDYFLAQKERPDVGLFISQPLVSRTDGLRIIGLSRRINKPDGSFGGVVVGTLHLDYLRNLFSKMQLGPNATLALFRSDGTIIMREPFDAKLIGRRVKVMDLFNHVAKADEGEFQTKSVIDGVERLIHYQHLAPLPLIQSVSLSVDDVYADWNRKALLIIGVLVLCCAIIAALAYGLRRELRGRVLAEAALVLLAEEDGLTGIANRRHFDQVLEAEWLKAAQLRTPLSLLMIDADHFKAYNDAFGHLQGDKALREVANCLKRHMRLPGELAARYGGEEFAVILPKTDAARAMEAAESIRHDILQLSLSNPGSRLHRLSISVGAATVTPDGSHRFTDIVAIADAALYTSKAQGRNRSTLQQTFANQAA